MLRAVKVYHVYHKQMVWCWRGGNNSFQAPSSVQRKCLRGEAACSLFSEAWSISADHQVPVKRPLVRPNILCLPSCLHSSAAHMATAQYCAGRCVGQCWALIGAEETAAPQPQEVHCNPSGTQSSAVKAALAPMQSPGRSNLTAVYNIKITKIMCENLVLNTRPKGHLDLLKVWFCCEVFEELY